MAINDLSRPGKKVTMAERKLICRIPYEDKSRGVTK